jgi:hypothetical protein
VRAQLVLEDPVGARAYALMKAGTLEAMSVGYDVLEGGETTRNGVRELSRLKAWEASIVTWGMNDLARIETVKSAMDCEHPRDLEELLRDTLFLSNRKAKAAANAMWPILTGERDAHADDRDDHAADAKQLSAIADQLKSITSLISPKGRQ